MITPKLERRYPSHQKAVELFGDRSLVRIEELYPGLNSGPDNYLRADTGPQMAAAQRSYSASWLSKESIVSMFERFLSIHDHVRTWEIGHPFTATAIRA